ncbi:MAG TPA: hypothetical protein VJ865_06825 [Gemmatimonadaceae bacterium]|nr:hypothetical protein [Gemmatimonadaceae bacterium]
MRRLILIAVLLIAPSVAGAQLPAEVRPGTRVRVWLPEPNRQEPAPEHRQVIRGTVESTDGSVLRLRLPSSGASLTVPRASIIRLDVSHGVNRGASMVERAAGGAIAGAVTFALMNDPRRTGGPHYNRDWRAAGVGAEWGAGIGAVVGLLFPHEQWKRVYGRWF